MIFSFFYYDMAQIGAKVKNPAQRTWLWFAPWKGALYDSALLNILMEYWKNENLTPIFCNLEQRPSIFSDA